VSRDAINESIQNLLKSYDLPTKNATVLRLGIEEGLQLANENKTTEENATSKTQRFLKSSEFTFFPALTIFESNVHDANDL